MVFKIINTATGRTVTESLLKQMVSALCKCMPMFVNSIINARTATVWTESKTTVTGHYHQQKRNKQPGVQQTQSHIYMIYNYRQKLVPVFPEVNFCLHIWKRNTLS